MLPNRLSHIKLHTFLIPLTCPVTNPLHVVPFVRCSDSYKIEGCWVEECALACCVGRTFWVMLGLWILWPIKSKQRPGSSGVCPHLYLWGSVASYQFLIMHGVRPWVQTSVSGNRPLMKKKKIGCCYAGSPSQNLSFLSHTLSSSLTVSLSALSPCWDWVLRHAKVKLSHCAQRMSVKARLTCL